MVLANWSTPTVVAIANGPPWLLQTQLEPQRPQLVLLLLVLLLVLLLLLLLLLLVLF